MTDSELPVTSSRIDATAADFLQRKRFWSWSHADQAELESWLNDHVLHRVAYLRLEAGQERIEKMVVLRPAARPPVRKADRNTPGLVRGVAGLVVCAALGLGGFYYFAPREQTYSTVVGGQKILKLADGSRIELNTDTALRMLFGASRREIWLDKGEAYFQVTHDATRPFVVNIGSSRVIDIGTKFVIRRNMNETAVSLLEGKARLDVPGPGAVSHSVVLTPGRVAMISRDHDLSVSEAPSKELNTELSWRRGVLILNRTSLIAAAAEFNRYNTGKLIVADPTIAQLTMSGAFPTNDTEAFSDALKDIFKLRVTRRGADTVITR